MSGRIELLPVIAIIVISVVAAITDLLRGKIYNWLTLPASVLGLTAALALGGWSRLGDSALGWMAGLLVYGWMFRIGVMGGGDVKLLMALGAWGGWRYTLETALLGVLLGGLMAALMLAFKGRLGDFSKRLYSSALSVAVKELEFQPPKIDRKLTMPYGLPIAVAAIWTILGRPLRRLGVWP